MEPVREDLRGRLGARWKRLATGHAALEWTADGLRFVIRDAPASRYSDAQIDDYRGLPRRRFPWRPPLRLSVRARFSHPGPGDAAPDATHLRGTAGFGFWNDPFLMTGLRWPALPRAIWFFYASPPSNLKLALDTPGYGWKAATLDALRPIALPLGTVAPLLVALMRVRRLYRSIWPPVQRALRIRERELHVDMTSWHTYQLEWGRAEATFCVDGAPVLEAAPAPLGPLGFVMWLDNQAMIATPWGELRHELLAVEGRQWMEVTSLSITPL